MATAAAETRAQSHSLEVRRTIRAPRQRVFDAWTQADQIRAFHAPGPMTVSLIEVDLRVGGAYRLHMLKPDGVESQASGVYTEVDPPRRVAYTWNWANHPEMQNTIVSLDFIERGDSTEVVLRHTGLPSEEEARKHNEGWSAIADKLCEHFGSPTSGVVHEACTD